MIRYRSSRPPDTELRSQLRELANARRRFGYQTRLRQMILAVRSGAKNLRRIAAEQCHTGGRCCLSQFLIERGKWQLPSPGKLKVCGIIDGKSELIGEGQRIGPRVGICLLVRRDIQEGKVGERGPAEIPIDAAVADGNCQAVGDLRSPDRHHGAILGDSVKSLADSLSWPVAVNPRKGPTVEYQDSGATVVAECFPF